MCAPRIRKTITLTNGAALGPEGRQQVVLGIFKQLLRLLLPLGPAKAEHIHGLLLAHALLLVAPRRGTENQHLR